MELTCVSLVGEGQPDFGEGGRIFVENPQKGCVLVACLYQYSNFTTSNLTIFNTSTLNTVSPMSSDFPCTHPGCPRTFKRLNSRTQHYNAHHRPLSPDSEPDPAHQFRVKYHPKLNGMYSLPLRSSTYCSFSIAM